LLQAGSFFRRQPGAPARIPLGLPHPAAQRLGRAADLLSDRRDRRPLGGVLLLVLQHHPHRPLPHLGGEPAWLGHDPILSRDGASRKPGAVHSPTFGAAFDNIGRYLHPHNEAARVSRTVDGPWAYLRHELVGLAVEHPRQHAEYSLVLSLNTLRLMAGS